MKASIHIKGLIAVAVVSAQLLTFTVAEARPKRISACPVQTLSTHRSKEHDNVAAKPGVYKTTAQRRTVVERLVSQPIEVPATDAEKLNVIVSDQR